MNIDISLCGCGHIRSSEILESEVNLYQNVVNELNTVFISLIYIGCKYIIFCAKIKEWFVTAHDIMNIIACLSISGKINNEYHIMLYRHYIMNECGILCFQLFNACTCKCQPWIKLYHADHLLSDKISLHCYSERYNWITSQFV